MTGWAERRALTTVTALVVVTVAACGGAGGDGGSPTADRVTTTAPEVEAPTTTMFVLPSIAPATLPAPAGCAPGELAVVSPGTLTVATAEDAVPPWVIGDPSSGSGFESAVAYAVAERMGFAGTDVSWVPAAPDEGFDAGQFDFSIQQHDIAGPEVADFSIAYYPTKHALVALPGSNGALATTMEHVSALSLGVIDGSTGVAYAEETAGATDVTGFATATEAFSALVAGEVDALVLDLPTAYELTPVEAPDAVIASVLPRIGSETGGLGLAFAPGSPLVECADAALASLRADGTLEALGVTWLEQSGGIPQILAETIETAGAEEAGDDVDHDYVIPAGTGELVAQGIVVDIMPSELSAVVGEVIRIVNQDDIGYVIGPFYVGPNETLRQRFLAAGEFVGECGVSATGTIALRVAEA